MQIKAKGLNVYTALEHRSERSLKEHPELNEKWVQELITMEQNRRGFLQVAGVAAATFTLDGLRSAAWAANEATGKMKIENVGLMSPGDMGQAERAGVFSTPASSVRHRAARRKPICTSRAPAPLISNNSVTAVSGRSL